MELVDGKLIAERIKDQVVQDIVNLKGEHPNLAIILVGDREDSKIYVNLKEKQAKTVGIDTNLYKCEADIKEEELLATIDYLNKDELIDAILIQLPLPEGLDTDKVVSRMDPAKDVDGFHPENLKKLLSSCDYGIEPPLVTVIFEILKEINCELAGKQVTALVNSDILGSAIKHVLECKGAHVTIVHDNDSQLEAKCSQADILITAIGKPEFITEEYVKEDAVIIDIGINRLEDGSVVGDVNQLSVEKKAGHLTPVPGGVGPITIAVAFRNTLELYKNRHKQ